MTSLKLQLAFCSLLTIFLSCSALSQTNPNIDQGLTPFGSYDHSNEDSVSLTTGNLMVHIPLFDYPQRGKQDLKVRIQVNGHQWYVKESCFGIHGCSGFWTWYPAGGIKVGQQPYATVVNDDGEPSGGTESIGHPQGGGNVCWGTMYTPDGGTHLVSSTGSTGKRSIDGTGFWLGSASTCNPSRSSGLVDRR